MRAVTSATGIVTDLVVRDIGAVLCLPDNAAVLRVQGIQGAVGRLQVDLPHAVAKAAVHDVATHLGNGCFLVLCRHEVPGDFQGLEIDGEDIIRE